MFDHAVGGYRWVSDGNEFGDTEARASSSNTDRPSPLAEIETKLIQPKPPEAQPRSFRGHHPAARTPRILYVSSANLYITAGGIAEQLLNRIAELVLNRIATLVLNRIATLVLNHYF